MYGISQTKHVTFYEYHIGFTLVDIQIIWFAHEYNSMIEERQVMCRMTWIFNPLERHIQIITYTNYKHLGGKSF